MTSCQLFDVQELIDKEAVNNEMLFPPLLLIAENDIVSSRSKVMSPRLGPYLTPPQSAFARRVQRQQRRRADENQFPSWTNDRVW